MDPNNNQPLATNPVAQSVPPIMPPTKKNNKAIILLLILLLLVAGMMAYILFAKNKIENAQKATTENNSTIVPSATPTVTPTLTPEEDLEVASPEADLIDLEADVKGL
ncbi:MAG: hypothetical protein Q7R51_01320 [bacterium]|nr:hypothetical protein [bacterium]